MRFTANAQVNLVNNHPSGCPIVVTYEAWPPGCGGYVPCAWGTVTINVGAPFALPAGCGVFDLCIIVRSIGGTPVPMNHTSRGPCHMGIPTSASGANPVGCNMASTMWFTTYLPAPTYNWVLS